MSSLGTPDVRLPVTHVTLYKNDVAFMERQAVVRDNASVVCMCPLIGVLAFRPLRTRGVSVVRYRAQTAKIALCGAAPP